jgi:hypothetical protein
MQNNPLFYPWGRWGKLDTKMSERIRRIRADTADNDVELDIKYSLFPNESATDFFNFPATAESLTYFQKDVQMEAEDEDSKSFDDQLHRSISDPALLNAEESSLLDLALTLSPQSFHKYEEQFGHCKCEIREWSDIIS